MFLLPRVSPSESPKAVLFDSADSHLGCERLSPPGHSGRAHAGTFTATRPVPTLGWLSSQRPLGLVPGFYRVQVWCLNVGCFTCKDKLGAIKFRSLGLHLELLRVPKCESVRPVLEDAQEQHVNHGFASLCLLACDCDSGNSSARCVSPPFYSYETCMPAVPHITVTSTACQALTLIPTPPQNALRAFRSPVALRGTRVILVLK